MSKSFLEKLHKFALQINFDFYNVSYGGCACVAVAFAKQLKKHFPVKILIANYDWLTKKNQDISKIRKKLNTNTHSEWNDNGVAFAHVLVEFEYEGKLYQLDTDEGVIPRTTHTLDGQYPILKGHMSLEDAEELATNVDGWNYKFDRSQLPDIYKAIDQFFRYNKPELTA